MSRFVLLISSNAGLGYIPFAPGTFGTLAGIPLFWLLAPLPPWLYAVTWFGLLAIACWAADYAGKYYGVVDDGRIVVDELVGYLVTVAFIPFTWTHALLGFFFFRLFDIAKPPPVSWIDERMKNGVGVVLDDVMAGLYAAAALQLCLRWLLPWLEGLL